MSHWKKVIEIIPSQIKLKKGVTLKKGNWNYSFPNKIEKKVSHWKKVIEIIPSQIKLKKGVTLKKGNWNYSFPNKIEKRCHIEKR